VTHYAARVKNVLIFKLQHGATERFDIEGRPLFVTVRGKVAARDGKFVGELGRGKLLTREPSGYKQIYKPWSNSASTV
jgi:hypothetical protein